MKRWLSGIMAFIIAFTCACCCLALADEVGGDEAEGAYEEAASDAASDANEEEEEDIVVTSDPVDGDVPQAGPVEFEGTLGDEPDDPDAPEEDPAEAPAAAPARRYARIVVDQAMVLDAPEGKTVAALGLDCAVMVLNDAAEGWLSVAFDTERGVLTGCAAADCLRVMEAAEAGDYLDALLSNEAVALYEGDLDAPLERVDCIFPETPGEESGSGEPMAEPSEDAAEEPTGDMPGEPAGEPADEPDEAPVEAPAEEPAGESAEEPAEESDKEPGEESTEEPDKGPGEESTGEPGEESTEEPDKEPDKEPDNGTAESEEVVTAEAADAQAEGTDAAPSETAVESAEASDSTPDPASVETAEVAQAAGLQLNMTACVLGNKERYKGLSVVSNPSGGAVTWKSSKPKVVKVNAKTGVIKAVKKGTAVVTATAADGSSASVTVTVKKAPKKIKFKPKKVTMGAGGMSMPLTLKMTKGAACAGLTFTSSNANVASVDANGVVTSHGAGTAVITAKTYNKKKARCKVIVYAEPARVEMPATFSLALGQKSTLGVQAYAADGSKTCAGLTYRIASNSANPECLAVDAATGTVTGASKGTATVTVTTHNGLSCGPCQVTVTSEPSGIKLPAKITMGNKESRPALAYELVAAGGDTSCATTVTWSSTNKKVVQVDPNTGALKAVKKGKATIVAKTHNGYRAKCRVTVKKAPKKVKLKASASEVNVGSTVNYTCKLPKGSAGACTFTSSDPGIATIDQNGVATGVSAGKVTITVTTYNGKAAMAALTVKGASGGGGGGGEKVDVPESLAKLGIASYQSSYNSNLSNAEKLEYVIYVAQNQLDKPYVYGGGYDGGNPSGFDCSGLVYYCFNKAKIKLEATAYLQGYDSKYTKISDISGLVRGDVVCFNTNGSSDNDLSDHTGIYLGKGYFIHASSGSSKRKVVVQSFTDDSISNDYYKRAFSWGRRILE